MPQLSLVLSEKFDTDFAETVRADLSNHLDVASPQFLFRKAADPTLISIIQLIGDAAAWLPLSAAATVYLSTLAKRAGDATWDGIASLFKSKEVKPLADVATTLTTTADAVEGDVEIFVGLNIPDDHFGTAIAIKARKPEELARVLASFIVRAEQLSKEMKAEVTAGRVPLGRAIIELEGDGSLIVKWHSQKDFEEHEKRIP